VDKANNRYITHMITSDMPGRGKREKNKREMAREDKQESATSTVPGHVYGMGLESLPTSHFSPRRLPRQRLSESSILRQAAAGEEELQVTALQKPKYAKLTRLEVTPSLVSTL
jgi:hypothetical protein